MLEVTTAIVLETRTPRKNGLYPVKLRLTHNRIQRYYSILIHNKRVLLSKSEFEKHMTSKKLTSLRMELDQCLQNSESILASLPSFSFEAFNSKWNSSKNEENDLFKGFKIRIERLEEEKRIGTALAYKDAKNSFKRFSKASEIRYDQVTTLWLNEYVNYMTTKGRSSTTISIYLRALRTVLNDEGKSFVKDYPFNGFKMPVSLGRKNEALELEELQRLAEFKSSNKYTQMAVDFWLFSYNCGGANFEDIFNLRWDNINYKTREVIFIRRKTRNTKKTDKRPIVVDLTARMESTISKYGSEQISTGYVFPFLVDELTEKRKKLRVKYITKNFNKHTIMVGEELKLSVKLTSTVARHTRASVMNFQNVHISIIGDMLGHGSLTTTEKYLKSFDTEKQKEAMRKSEI